jgi:hypothetical protein
MVIVQCLQVHVDDLRAAVLRSMHACLFIWLSDALLSTCCLRVNSTGTYWQAYPHKLTMSTIRVQGNDRAFASNSIPSYVMTELLSLVVFDMPQIESCFRANILPYTRASHNCQACCSSPDIGYAEHSWSVRGYKSVWRCRGMRAFRGMHIRSIWLHTCTHIRQLHSPKRQTDY